MDKIHAVAGIEVSQAELLVLVRSGTTTSPVRRFENHPAGRQAVARLLRKAAGRGRVRVALEPTGTYSLDLALQLHAEPTVELIVPNPKAVRRFAEALMIRDKRDPQDAAVLLEYAARMPDTAWQAPSEAALRLRAITRRMASLREQITAEKNRLHADAQTATSPPVVRETTTAVIHAMEAARKALTQEAKAMIAADPTLNRRFSLLLSVPGIAQCSALRILGELVVLPANMTERQWVSHAGLYPTEHSSGSSVRRPGRIGKAGCRELRTALFMPALVAARWAPAVGAFYQRLIGRGLAKLQALVAVMRKLLHAIHGMFASNTPFDHHRFSPALLEATA